MNRIIATSDWHGLSDRARTLIAKTKWNHETDELIVLGDMIDRGPDSLGCVAFARLLEEQGATILMGNHEDMAVQAFGNVFKNPNDPKWDGKALAFHLENGGDKFWNQVTEKMPNLLDIMRWFEHLPLYHSEVLDFGYMFVHAGWDTVNPSTQTKDFMLWARDDFMEVPSPKDYTVVFGHTPTKYLRSDSRQLIYHGDHKIGIDCGAIFGGLLAAISLPDGEEFYA